SRTQPAKRQASIRTTVGPCRSISPVSTARLVETVTKRTSPAGRTTQATLLYLPRSMARMVSAAVALANVVIVQAPWGRWGVEVWQLSRYHDPTACMDSFGVKFARHVAPADGAMKSLSVRAGFALAILAAVMGLLLFVPAGTVHYWQAWVYLSNFMGASALTSLYLLRRDPALLERRMSGGPMAEKRPAQRLIMLATS